MDLSRNQEEGNPLPINSYGHGQVMHHDHHQQQQQDHDLLSSVEPQIPATYRGPTLEGHHQIPLSNKKWAMKVRYRECLKNHAASMGGNATDGCGEFMPSGAEGTIEALTCSACSCHRNFHRKETDHHHHHHQPHILGHLHPQPLSLGCPTLIPLRAAASPSARHNNTSADQYYNVDDHRRQVQFVKKRFRTKFTPEQKGKMLEFAERTGWRLQRQEEGVVQQFCQEIGVKRRVLKVWMHNNKHNLARKNDNNND